MILFSDSETDGLPSYSKPLSQQPKILEWAMIKLDPVTLEEVDVFNKLYNPERPIDPKASEINGIYDDDVKDQPTFKDDYDNFLAFIDGCEEMWFHNASFDVKMLNFELARINKIMTHPKMKYGCTLELARQKFPHAENHKLQTLHKEFCEPSTMQTHRALDDVRLTIDVYKVLTR